MLAVKKYVEKNYLFGFSHIIRDWKDTRSARQSPPRRLDIVYLGPTKAVELFNQGLPKIVVGLCSLGIASILIEEVAHAIKVIGG